MTLTTETDPLVPAEPGNGLCRILSVYIGFGVILVATYIWGILELNDRFAGNSKNANQIGANNLWGSIYDNKAFMGVYYVGMVCAAVGYMMSLGHVVKVADRNMSSQHYNSVCVSLAVFFLFSWFWMPMCVQYISHPTDGMWWAIFLQLKVSGITSVVWAYLHVKAARDAGTEKGDGQNQGYPWIGAIGAAMFAAHCMVLDGCIWSFYFGTDGRLPPLKA